MSSAVRYHRLMRRVAFVVLAACVAVAVLLLYGVSNLPSPREALRGITVVQRLWCNVASLSGTDWTLFRNIRGGTSPALSSLAQRFRLAGIFCWSAGEIENDTSVRKAIIDNLRTKQEFVVCAGDLLDGVTVQKILDKSVVLHEGGVEEELSMAYAGAATGTVVSASSTGTVEVAAGEKIVSTNRFGAYVGDNRWILSRESLLGYVEELKESPTRVSQLFDSMEPVYVTAGDGRRMVDSYALHVVGEKEFYDSVGLQEGDVVRRVNTMPVTSKRRAMFWIDEFRAGRASAFVMDIERNGNPMRIEYMMR